MELEPPTNFVLPPTDRRRHVPEPPPVRLTAIEDVHLSASVGLESQLDEFYVGLLSFDRDPNYAAAGEIIYRAENVRLILQMKEGAIERLDLRPITVEVQSLQATEARIVEREIPYERMHGLLPGQDALLLQDPAGNGVYIVETREVR